MKNHVLTTSVGAFLIVSICVLRAEAQMPTAPLTNVTTLQSCPSGVGFYTSDPYHPTACFSATVTCPNTAAINITWSVTNPGATQGTIVFFSGGGGEAAATFPGEEQAFIPGYVSANYQVVQTSWASDWENTNTGTSTTYPFNVRTAACRPASFLAYAYANIYPASQNSLAGMCAQGASAGSAAIAYSLAWYNAASFLDKVEMLVGPPLSDLKRGCQVPNNNYVLMCQNQQLGCNGWAVTDPPGYSLEYTDHKDAVEGWSGGIAVTGPACAGTTPTTNDANWLHMSIVDLSGFSGNPSFSYPQTAMGAWLCENDTEGTMNNAGSQGEIFYQQFTQASQLAPNYLLNAVTACHNAEGVPYGTPPPNWVALGLTPAAAAISYDMSDSRSAAVCKKRH